MAEAGVGIPLMPIPSGGWRCSPALFAATERVAVNVEIMRAFVELRRVANSYTAIEKRLEEVERELGGHDEQLNQIFMALRQLISPPDRPKCPVGFRLPEDDE
ncbi:MAG TPA: hypothetical protein VFM94_03520 [Solirubrobacterales bacterium]|nr:hypothetical protein [Solirubrobacterales bacterium]